MAGQRTHLIYPTGQTVTYTHDAAGRLTQVLDWSGGTTVYTYTDAGRLSGMARPNGVTSAYSYDSAGRLGQIEHHDLAAQLLARYTYTLDSVGNRLSVTETFTTPRSITYTYDPLNRLTAAAYSTGESYGYQYDAVGNRAVMTDATGAYTYTYDAANRLTGIELPDSSIRTYTWDARGNLIHDGVFAYTYSATGRMVRAASITTTLVYTYTVDGLRIAQADLAYAGAQTYVWDWASAVPELLADWRYTYLIGHDSLGWEGARSPMAPVVWTYVLPDALGSVRQETDAAGVVTAVREWSPYGEELGGAQAGLGFTGEWFDPSMEMTYLRARWYHPSVGQFLTRDPWPGTQLHPMSFQPYMYANNAPVRYVDPLGLYSCLTDQQWAPELIGLCLLLDSSPEARNIFYRNGIVVALGIVGWQDAQMLFKHWLGGTGETMYFGSRLVGLIERDTMPLIGGAKDQFLKDAAQSMRGKAGNMPWGHDEDFLSNASGIPARYASGPYPISEEAYIALGGVWFHRYYRGTVTEETPGTYRISLRTDFAIDKYWSFRPNTEMYPDIDPDEVPENPPAEFNLAERIGIPLWLPRPVLVHPPIWTVINNLPWIDIPVSTGNPWSAFLPDEWGYALEQGGYAAPFMIYGHWTRTEEFLAVDHNCDGWGFNDIVGGPTITFERLPLNVDPVPTATYLYPGVK